MDAQQFLAEFGHIANAPGGVQCLREMIYNLAITGDLTQQFPKDGDAQTLLESINFARQRLIQSKQFKRTAKLESEPLQVPDNIALPTSWCWTRLLDIGEISPRNEAKDDDTAAFIPMSGISQLHNGVLVSEDREWGDIKKGFTHFANGDVVIAKITPCFENGKAAVIAGLNNPLGIGAGTTELHVFRTIHSDVLPSYVYIFLRSPFFADEGERNMTGTAGQKRLPTEYFATRAMPLPPIAEQVRIVAKVDELMALCDKLESQQQEQIKIETSARKATLQELVNADIVSLSPSLARLDRNLHALFKTPDSIDDFLSSLKELAVRGLLTANTGVFLDVSEIQTACAAQRVEYISAGWMRKQKIVLAPDSTVDYPSNWAVIPFDDVALVIGGVTKGRDLRGRDVLTCPYLSVANVQRGFFKLENVKTIQIAEGELGKYRVQDGDLLITEGGDWDKVGRTAIWHGGIENCLHQNHVFKARVPSDQLLNEWVELVFNSNIGRDYFAGASKQTTNLASINMTQLRSFPLPIPPLIEQKAILYKLATLSEICRTWRDQLVQARKLASLLAMSSVESITGIRNEEEEEALKTPKTELISKLRLANSPDIKEQAPLAAILARHHDEMPANDLWQRYGGDIDAFYAQLKLEVGKGWIEEPAIAEMRETEAG